MARTDIWICVKISPYWHQRNSIRISIPTTTRHTEYKGCNRKMDYSRNDGTRITSTKFTESKLRRTIRSVPCSSQWMIYQTKWNDIHISNRKIPASYTSIICGLASFDNLPTSSMNSTLCKICKQFLVRFFRFRPISVNHTIYVYLRQVKLTKTGCCHVIY